MKRHIWTNRRFSDNPIDTVEIIIRDASLAKIESWIINVNDKKRARQILKVLKSSYGIDFGVGDTDLSWLKEEEDKF